MRFFCVFCRPQLARASKKNMPQGFGAADRKTTQKMPSEIKAWYFSMHKWKCKNLKEKPIPKI
jgi:hypothetical protein